MNQVIAGVKLGIVFAPLLNSILVLSCRSILNSIFLFASLSKFPESAILVCEYCNVTFITFSLLFITYFILILRRVKKIKKVRKFDVYKLAGIAGVFLILPFFVLFFSYLGKIANAYSTYTTEQNVLGINEKVVSAEVSFAEELPTGRVVSSEERTQIVRKVSSEIQSGDRRVIVLRAYLETMPCANGDISPLANFTEDIVKSSDKYGLDWRYIVAISGVETWFGCAGGAEKWNNAWGYGGGPATRFHYASWSEGIDAFAKGFASGYGTQDLDFKRFASYYTTGLPGSNDRWANGVLQYIRGIDAMDEELK